MFSDESCEIFKNTSSGCFCVWKTSKLMIQDVLLTSQKLISLKKKWSRGSTILEKVIETVSHPEVFCEKNSQNSQENTCVRVYFSIKSQVEACNFIKKETLTHVFCCTFCEFFKNTFFIEHFRWLLLKMLKSESESLFNKVTEAFRLATLLKRDSNTDAFLLNLRNLYEHLFWRTSANDSFCTFRL